MTVIILLRNHIILGTTRSTPFSPLCKSGLTAHTDCGYCLKNYRTQFSTS